MLGYKADRSISVASNVFKSAVSVVCDEVNIETVEIQDVDVSPEQHRSCLMIYCNGSSPEEGLYFILLALCIVPLHVGLLKYSFPRKIPGSQKTGRRWNDS